ncbi:class I SAM-dependent methyltransferase [Roseateles paludis]|jgi:SAM-dependent methyltransferase|uniref:SAM-dependent methyltransferase n=1 Tax=Roseateles paludis TaxID=3145238 RepID=A0ABV0G4C2_9BURK
MFSHLVTPPPAVEAEPAERFVQRTRTALAAGRFVKLLLASPCGDEEGLERVTVRRIELKGQPLLSWLWRYQTRDVTKNLGLEESLQQLAELLGSGFRNAHLHTDTEELQFALSRKGRASLRSSRTVAEPEAASHDKAKQRPLDLKNPVWAGLGLTHLVKGEPALVPAMARKWKQINRFVEIFSAAVADSALAGTTQPVRVADFGSGKGYLTFALHDWLQRQGLQPRVTGLELRRDMVELCNAVVADNALQGLRFDEGDLRSVAASQLDVMVALHACDIATDHALHLGIQAGAQILLSSPCCHKELRPQMQLPSALRPMLKHGIHLGQEAEMVTDSLRALLLEAQGYTTQVFEFIALEHTSKNKMILAVKAHGPAAAALAARRDELLAQIAEIKRFYGLREQRLEQLLAA